MKKMPNRIAEFLSRLQGFFRGTHVIRGVAELPEQPATGTLYLVGEGQAWSAGLVCPCGCGKLIQLSMLQDEFPKWSVEVTFWGLPTVEPSVWRTSGCRSHFFLQKGKIRWCGPEPPR